VRKLLTSALVLALAGSLGLVACGSDDDGDDAGGAATTASGVTLPATTLAPVAPTTYEGEGDATIDIELPIPDAPAAATFTNTVAGPFVVDAIGTSGDVTTNLVDRIGTYEGTVPIDANTAQEKTTGLQIQAPGQWKVVINALRSLPVMEGSRSGDSDDLFLYLGEAQEGGFTFEGQGTAVLIAYPTLDGGFPDTLASLDGADGTPANVDLPGNALIQVTAEGPWELTVSA
jgi:hypothetical protein